MRRFAYLILEGRRPVLTSFLFVSTWFLMNMSSCLQRLWKLDVFVPTNTWLRIVVKMLSTCGFACILSTSTASTRCCHVQELIGWHFIYKSSDVDSKLFIFFFGFYWKKVLYFLLDAFDLNSYTFAGSRPVWEVPLESPKELLPEYTLASLSCLCVLVSNTNLLLLKLWGVQSSSTLDAKRFVIFIFPVGVPDNACIYKPLAYICFQVW